MTDPVGRTTASTEPAIRCVGVIVPAHDEEDTVAATLASLQIAAACVELPVIVVVVLDSCSDRTADVVRRCAETDEVVDWHVLTTSARRASSSRQNGLDRLVDAIDGRWHPSHVAVLSTDADTVVPPGWITHHVARLDGGDDAVAGIVDLERRAGDAAVYESWRAEYESNFGEDGTHPHVHCANLAVRLDALVAVRGFGDLARAEDIDLWRRLRTTTARLRSDPTSVVRTSARLDGRVTGGFATALREMSDRSASAPPDVEPELLAP